MKILHTADLHLGIKLEDRSRIEEQADFLTQLATIADQHQIDLILLAGDIYHTANPSSDSERLFYRSLKTLSKNGTRPIFIIAGNHDHPERLSSAQPLTLDQGIIFAKTPRDTLPIDTYEHYTIADSGPGFAEIHLKGEQAVILFMPYPSDVTLNEIISTHLTESEAQKDYSQKVGQLFAQNTHKYRKDTINLAMGHFHISGATASTDPKSERDIVIGGAYAVNLHHLPKEAQYIAMGHLHRPQQMGNAYYSGSPIAYSLSEADHNKSVNILDITPSEVSVSQIPIVPYKPIHRVKVNSIENAFELIEAKVNDHCWIYLDINTPRVLTTSEIKALRKLHKDIVVIRPHLMGTDDDPATGETLPELSIEDEFHAFYKSKREGTSPSPETLALFLKLTQEAQ